MRPTPATDVLEMCQDDEGDRLPAESHAEQGPQPDVAGLGF